MALRVVALQLVALAALVVGDGHGSTWVAGDGNCSAPPPSDPTWTGASSSSGSGRRLADAITDATCERTAAATADAARLADVHPHQHDSLLAPMVLFVVGAAVRHFLLWSHAPLPYTVNLLLIGIGLGLAIRFYHTMIEAELASGACATSRPLWSDIFQRSLETLAFIDPHLLLHLLLPPLVFESAFAIDWHIFDQLKWVTLLLAVPGARSISPTSPTSTSTSHPAPAPAASPLEC